MKQPRIQPVFDVFPSYRGGSTTQYGGYVWEFCPGHPRQNQWGFVAQHRLVGEDIAGRQLLDGEVVHHDDECRTNNSPGNLKVMTQQEHRRHHGRLMAIRNLVPLTAEQVAAALEGRSLKTAARLLKVDTQTLRNRFPELTSPRQRKSPTKIDNPRDLAAVLAAAPLPDIGLRELRKTVQMSDMTILRICKRHGVEWVKKRRTPESYTGRPTNASKATRASPPEPVTP